MTMYKTILVATDLTETSAPAMRHAIALAHQLGGEVVALHVTRPFDPGRWLSPFAPDETELLRSLAQREQQAAQRILEDQTAGEDVARWGIPVTAVVKTGDAATVIAAVARELPAHLLVVGTHARQGLSHALIGSVAEKLLRLAPCPVVIARTEVRG
jgi:universal stress protein A